MHVSFAVLADAAAIDLGGKASILGIFNQIAAAKFPIHHPQLSLVLQFMGGAQDIGDHELVVRILDPDGQEINGLTGLLAFHAVPGIQDGVIVPHIIRMSGLVFEKPGRYSVDVLLDGEHQVSTPLTILKRAKPKPPKLSQGSQDRPGAT